jgi:class 3 adenylate cyclase
MKRLISLDKARFTKLFYSIWAMFILLHMIEITNLINIYTLNTLYLTADMIGKITTTFVMHDNKEYQYILSKNIDLQCINFISYMLQKIKKYESKNVNQSKECVRLINYIKNKLTVFIPKNKQELQLELLKKILPFGFEKSYILNKEGIINTDTDATISTNTNKQFNMICVLFTDIVSYTELAKQYDDEIIFNLLNNIYTKFDVIIKKYFHLQKIETIGDAYMVVGDIFRSEINHKVVVKEIILLALEFIKEIKKIKTPNKIPLCIRIGINMGTVNVGILGNEIPRLCVVGNTVNVAARLQSTADADTIQMSRHVYEHAEEIDFGFPIEYVKKDNIFLKNIGSVNTFNICPPLNSP